MNVKTMKRVLVIGCPGSGKTTFAIALCERTALHGNAPRSFPFSTSIGTKILLFFKAETMQIIF